jgi:hypothetical protein
MLPFGSTTGGVVVVSGAPAVFGVEMVSMVVMRL